MGKMVQIRNMPDAIHRTVKARAAEEGMSLSEYLLREIRRSAERPTNKQIMERLAKLPPLIPKRSAADTVRDIHEGREERMRELDQRTDRIKRRR